MPTLMQTLKDLNTDLEVYKMRLKKPKLGIILLFPGFQALAFYRFQVWLNTHRNSPRYKNPIWWPVIALEVTLKRFVEIITGIHFSPEAKIQTGLYIPHFGSMGIAEYAEMGKNGYISPGVSVGYDIKGDIDGFPKIGDRVFIAPDAVILGPITLGNDVLVGANSVVTKSYPDRVVLAGVPARVISTRGSFDYQLYPGMDTDPERLASLAQSDPADASRTYRRLILKEDVPPLRSPKPTEAQHTEESGNP